MEASTKLFHDLDDWDSDAEAMGRFAAEEARERGETEVEINVKSAADGSIQVVQAIRPLYGLIFGPYTDPYLSRPDNPASQP